MKIAFLVEYFEPFNFGGSEISSNYLARGLKKRGVNVVVIAPNFGSKNKEILEGIKIRRYPFPKKIKDNNPLTPFWHNSLLISIYRTIKIYQMCKEEKVNLIHVQEKYLLIAGVIVSKLLKIPLVVSVRDYQLLCSFGFCINSQRNYRACNFIEFWFKDFRYYLKHYTSGGNILNEVLLAVFALRARIIQFIYKLFLQFADQIICVSRKQSLIYSLNGIEKNMVIYNPMNANISSGNKRKKPQILYVGKLSKGKGIEQLIKSLAYLINNKSKIKLVVVGLGNIEYYSKLVNSLKLQNIVSFHGRVEHRKVLNLYDESLLTVVPSVWEEPFGRTALESLFRGTPVVASNKGGLPEIVDDELTGYIYPKGLKDLVLSIEKALKNQKLLSKNIKNRIPYLKNKFGTEVFKKHINLYQGLIK